MMAVVNPETSQPLSEVQQAHHHGHRHANKMKTSTWEYTEYIINPMETCLKLEVYFNSMFSLIISIAIRLLFTLMPITIF